ncbi:GNAT family N-acetyltransferase [Nocardioides dongkuii]|uniref:GNAT family N-acetyltransferase n=1 Tax=Nocardioides dongkuii TaxID=2760089 RepID=UPI0015FB4D8D|nr:GNAT family N-acetyltransferase [Nocardioides dongkuii]
MSGYQVVPLDVDDDVAYAAWHRVYEAAERHGRGASATPWQAEELRVMIRDGGTRSWSTAYAGLLGGELVATGRVRLPLLDNRDRAELAVHVHPDHRRRGYGRAMLARLEEVARGRGRTILGGETRYAYGAGAEGIGESGPEFARACGYVLGLGDVQRELRLPVDDALLDALAAEAAPHHAAYTLRSWVGPVPEELLQGWADLASTLMTEAPTGDLTLEPESASTAAVREDEAETAKKGRTKLHTVALAADGTVAAYTDLACTDHGSDRGYQWGTLVRRDHRGHRLGLAVKVANLRQLQQLRPSVRTLVTYNAEVNEHMVGVNDRLGYTPTARLGEFQKTLA